SLRPEKVAAARHDWLAEQFEETRGHLRAIAYRMLGSAAEAGDAVQESWLRLSRTRRRVQGKAAGPPADHAHRRDVVDAFLAALRGGDFEGLIAALDPDVVVRVDEAGRIWVRQERSAGRGTGPMGRSPFHRLPASPTDARRRRGGSCLGSRWM